MTAPVRILLAALAAVASVLIGISAGAPASAATGWTSVSAGQNHTCGIRLGKIYCWGDNEFGQLGDGTVEDRSNPTPIKSGASDWKSVSAGAQHTCGIRAGRIACWGQDQYGQLGDGTAAADEETPDSTPGLIASGATDWKSVSAGGYHTCAIRAGRIACWGVDYYGELGDGSASGTEAADPTPGSIASGATDWTSVSAGLVHTCATRTGRIACWGWDQYGQLGDGAANSQGDGSPGFIRSGATDWKSVSAGSVHTCATRAGRVACWGQDQYGQLGDGTAAADEETPDSTPGLIASGATDWTSVSVGETHTCATRAGRVACWGADFNGQLGDGTSSGDDSTPDPSPGFIASGATDWKSVTAGYTHTCAIRLTRVACWGHDEDGQLGDGNAGQVSDPTPGFTSF